MELTTTDSGATGRGPSSEPESAERPGGLTLEDIPEVVPIVRRAVLRYARGAEVEDLVQETCLRLVREVQKPGSCLLRRYIPLIARNVCVDHLRRAYRRPAHDSLSDPRIPGERPRTSPWGPREHALAAEFERRLHTALSSLPPRQRRVLEWTAFEGVSAAVLGLRLGVGRGAARLVLHRARRRLGERLSQT